MSAEKETNLFSQNFSTQPLETSINNQDYFRLSLQNEKLNLQLSDNELNLEKLEQLNSKVRS